MSQPDLTRLTRRQAEKVAGVSRATLARYVADGKLSTSKNAEGHNVYDASELRRVFPETFDLARLVPASEEEDEAPSVPARDGGDLSVLSVELRYLKEDRDRLREENERLRREASEERQKRDDERGEFMALLRQHQDTVKQLTDQRAPSQPKEKPAPPRRGVWAWLVGR